MSNANDTTISVYPDSSIQVEAQKTRTEQNKTHNFVEFSEISEYRQVNKDLLEKALSFLPRNLTHIIHVDNATGTGLIPQLAAELYQRHNLQATIVGIDPDLYALQEAATRIHTGKNIKVMLIQGFGQDVQKVLKKYLPNEKAHITGIHDAIHEIPGLEVKKAIFAAQAKALQPGGVTLYNSAFTTVGMGDSPVQWGKWKLNGFLHFNEGRDKSVQAIELYTPDQYKQMILESGLKIIHEELKVVPLSLDALKAIARYPEFVNGVFRDMTNTNKYSLLEKSDALIASLEKEKITSLPRLWHEIIAQKPL